MTRIIGGEARGRPIKVPPGEGTRPTSDRVREALFSSLEAELGSLAGLSFLDLYAGSGAVGLEARSRGARAVTLVEQDRRAAAVIGGNARSLGFGEVVVRNLAVGRWLGRPAEGRFDAVFLDPPYALGDERVHADLGALRAGWLSASAVVVVERATRGGAMVWPAGFAAARSRPYGETTLWYGRATDAPGESPGA